MPGEQLIKEILAIGRQLIFKEIKTDVGKVDVYGMMIFVTLIIIFVSVGAPWLVVGDFQLEGTLPLLVVLGIYIVFSMLMIPPEPPKK